MWFLLFLACSKPAPAPPAEPVVPPAPVPVAVESLPPCVEACLRESMARAVSRDVIEADCRKTCSAEGAVVRAESDLDLRLGQRVVVEGTYQRRLLHGHGPEPYMATAVVLPDGTPVWVATGADPAPGWAKLLDVAISVEGTLASGEGGAPGVWLRDAAPPTRQ